MKLKVKMQNLGHKLPKPKPMQAVPERSKETVVFPELRLADRHIQGLENLQRGHKCKLTFDAEVCGTRDEDNEYRKEMSADFKLIRGSIEAEQKKSPKTTAAAVQNALKESNDY